MSFSCRSVLYLSETIMGLKCLLIVLWSVLMNAMNRNIPQQQHWVACVDKGVGQLIIHTWRIFNVPLKLVLFIKGCKWHLNFKVLEILMYHCEIDNSLFHTSWWGNEDWQFPIKPTWKRRSVVWLFHFSNVATKGPMIGAQTLDPL
jgi:hypothetical protein